MSIAATEFALEPLVLALATVDGTTVACRTHGDRETATVLAHYYALAADSVADVGGRVVKVIGDGVLLTFPLPRAKEAVAALRQLQAAGTALWSAFDSACKVRIKVDSGTVATGMMGPPGAEHFDVYGTALNELFRAPGGAFTVLPALAVALGS